MNFSYTSYTESSVCRHAPQVAGGGPTPQGVRVGARGVRGGGRPRALRLPAPTWSSRDPGIYLPATSMDCSIIYVEGAITCKPSSGPEFSGQQHDRVVVCEGPRVPRASPLRRSWSLPQQQHRLSPGQGTGTPGQATVQQLVTPGNCFVYKLINLDLFSFYIYLTTHVEKRSDRVV